MASNSTRPRCFTITLDYSFYSTFYDTGKCIEIRCARKNCILINMDKTIWLALKFTNQFVIPARVERMSKSKQNAELLTLATRGSRSSLLFTSGGKAVRCYFLFFFFLRRTFALCRFCGGSRWRIEGFVERKKKRRGGGKKRQQQYLAHSFSPPPPS